MTELESLLDESSFVQKRRAESFAEGEAVGLQKAVVTIVENRFPPLAESVKQKISHVQRTDRLQLILKATFTIPDEKMLQTIIDLLATL